ncbi:MAG: class I SAM-dependent methyltransferase [Firmicutes bacterium]|mgnify:CR=1 FL=1|uniref:Putative rRNA methylase n=1 Tax=Melghirimyces thermohalophilus TaxID=1236220 RepID=A0A1G6PYG1_9BACL|nr:class I SAM-dependent methyltransferase [Melghirimyces thermohalophilus]MDA8353069.1 class I SAM-dependent methyltransferase [Bacillota bacterium]SDC84437.1 Putative rRNA methylase [Melghirimyces thermohalophilus]
MSLPTALTLSHQLIQSVLQPGAWAVDATVGNGHDTLFLAQSVGDQGHVHGFDIQAEALARAEALFRKHQVQERITLHQRSHDQLAKTLPPDWRGRVAAVMFNLGYLPKGNSSIITRCETTLPALSQALEWLSPGGILTAVLYTGHPGGKDEADRVLRFAATLPPRQYRSIRYQTMNRDYAPSLVAVIKSKKQTATKA